ncbi:MAG: hypothetical protein E6G10_05590 [Actinobacteria bacterium]|nr:MAG: hypothetical protein E6G10_05590 [Actinomycetota bacterium]
MPNQLWKKLVLALSAAAALVAVPAAGAGAAIIETSACDGAALSTPFAPWGDTNAYKLVPGGDAEGSLAGWTLAGGAKKVAGSEPFAVTGRLGASSLSIPAGGSVTTSSTCVNAAYPSFRFFAKSSGGLLGLVPALKVELVYRDGLLGLVAVPAGVLASGSTWQPTPAMLTLSAVGAAVAGGEAPLAVRFTAVAGTWQVDDVYVDPHIR